MQIAVNKRFMSIFIIVTLIIGSFMMGMYFHQKAYADIGQLTNTDGYWSGTSVDNGVSTLVKQNGKYKVTITGEKAANYGTYAIGGYGGALSGYINLEYGDELSIAIYNGGTAGHNRTTAGGKAIMLFLNGTPVIGAGGGGGCSAYDTQYSGTEQYYNGPSVGAGQPPTIINETFSAGGGGTFTYQPRTGGASVYPGGPGETWEECTPAAAGTAGTNYLDQNYVTLIDMPNQSTSISFLVEYVKRTAEDDSETMSTMAQNVGLIAQAIEGLQGSSEEIPHISVVAGREFQIMVVGNDDMTSGTVDGITVTNDTVGDGVIVISGTVSTPGAKVYKINGRKIAITALQEPDSSNVTVIF